jgi:hypothetical protein
MGDGLPVRVRRQRAREGPKGSVRDVVMLGEFGELCAVVWEVLARREGTYGSRGERFPRDEITSTHTFA